LVASTTPATVVAALGRWRRHHTTRERSFEEVLHFLVNVLDAWFFSLVVIVIFILIFIVILVFINMISVVAFEWAVATASFGIAAIVAIDESSLPVGVRKSPAKNVLKVVLVLLLISNRI
jgi:hypothetical protein